jgi:hypothetical protein
MGAEYLFLVAVGVAVAAYYVGFSRGWSNGFSDAERIYSDSAEARVDLYREAYLDSRAKYLALLKQHPPV